MISSNNIFYHELIGLELKVVDSSNDSLIGISGTVVDETKKTFLIEAKPRSSCENIETCPGRNSPIQESSNLSSRSTGSFIRKDVAINSDSALKLIPKDVSIFEFKVPDGTIVEIDGKILLNRPEDRIKRDIKKFNGDNMIGLNVKEPENTCDDPNCPFHGNLSVRGQVLEGIVTTNKAERTITVERSFYKFIRKYERYEKRRSRINVHKPDCIDVEVGDSVKIAECRPLSKTKHFVLVEVKGDE